MKNKSKAHDSQVNISSSVLYFSVCAYVCTFSPFSNDVAGCKHASVCVHMCPGTFLAAVGDACHLWMPLRWCPQCLFLTSVPRQGIKHLFLFTHTHTQRKKKKEIESKWQRERKMPLLSFALSIRPAGWQWVIHGAGMVPGVELAHWHQASRPAYSTVWPCRGCGAKAGHSLHNSLLHCTLPFILCTSLEPTLATAVYCKFNQIFLLNLFCLFLSLCLRLLQSLSHHSLFCTPMGFNASVFLNALYTVSLYLRQHMRLQRDNSTLTEWSSAQKQTIHPSQTFTLSKCLLTEHFFFWLCVCVCGRKQACFPSCRERGMK